MPSPELHIEARATVGVRNRYASEADSGLFLPAPPAWRTPLPGVPARLCRIFSEHSANALFERLIAEIPCNDGAYFAGGRRFTLPRLQSWHADPGVSYRYAANLCNSHPWTPLLLALRESVQALTGASFNAVLANLYRDGQDSVGWHADDEPDLGPAPLIASLSLGATRRFCIRSKGAREGAADSLELALPSASLLVMDPPFQRDFEHSVPAEPMRVASRLNLTFRRILSDTDQT